MAPLSVRPPRSKPVISSPPVLTAAATVLHQLKRLSVLIYILLGTSAVFAFAILVWRLGGVFRRLTLGRVLRPQKQIETRYIKTWYGWIPQDRYESRRQKCGKLFSNVKNWFAWDGGDEYSKIWWDSESRANPVSMRRQSGSINCRLQSEIFNKTRRRPRYINPNEVIKKENVSLTVPTIQSYRLLHQPPLAFLTYPLCLRSVTCNITVQHFKSFQTLILPRGTFTLPGQSELATEKALMPMSYHQEWAMRLQLGSLQSVLSHHAGTIGRPGSPESRATGSDHQPSTESRSWTVKSISLRHGSYRDQDNSPARFTRPGPPNLHRDIPSQGACFGHPPTGIKSEPCMDKQNAPLEVEQRFVDRLRRELGWLYHECQAGRRGFKFVILPENWINPRKRLDYTHPCGSSIEYMRRDIQCRRGTLSYKNSDTWQFTPRRHQRRRRPILLESWRECINTVRREKHEETVRSVEIFLSSSEDTPTPRIETENWMLRRPPQGPKITKKQQTAYYYGGQDRWARLDEWWADGNAFGI